MQISARKYQLCHQEVRRDQNDAWTPTTFFSTIPLFPMLQVNLLQSGYKLMTMSTLSLSLATEGHYHPTPKVLEVLSLLYRSAFWVVHAGHFSDAQVFPSNGSVPFSQVLVCMCISLTKFLNYNPVYLNLFYLFICIYFGLLFSAMK